MDFNYRFLKGAIAVITPVFATAHDVNSPKGQPDPGKAIDVIPKNCSSSKLE
ncbi:hypothetical protein SAMN05216417_106218 [Nitrosospira multiformis]|uniref:Uncharacterized protein n=1 Tax=Nitrosospira multiformis TaxID=1231 RepID=A0A1I7H2A9_9PROT|nr:hypothetical protein SAMN05216417_106218 [Nitrosospira multiformis]